MRNWYFGKEEYEQYGDMVYNKLNGKVITKNREKANQEGGLLYEAAQLNLDWTTLLSTLEGLCYNGKAREIDFGNSYKVGA